MAHGIDEEQNVSNTFERRRHATAEPAREVPNPHVLQQFKAVLVGGRRSERGNAAPRRDRRARELLSSRFRGPGARTRELSSEKTQIRNNPLRYGFPQCKLLYLLTELTTGPPGLVPAAYLLTKRIAPGPSFLVPSGEFAPRPHHE